MTPLSTEKSLDLRTKQLRWAALDTFLRNFTSNLIKDCTKNLVPATVRESLTFALGKEYEFYEDDLLEFEKDNLKFKPKSRRRKEPANDKE